MKTKRLIFRIFVFVLLIILLALGINRYWNRYKLVHSPLYPKMHGTYELISDLSSIDRSYEIHRLWGYMQIYQNKIHLPSLEELDLYYNTDTYSIFGITLPDENRWKIISNNPDSIYIDASSHPLHGKYQVTFKMCPSGSLGYTTEYFMCLDNDSTHLCLIRIE